MWLRLAARSSCSSAFESPIFPLGFLQFFALFWQLQLFGICSFLQFFGNCSFCSFLAIAVFDYCNFLQFVAVFWQLQLFGICSFLAIAAFWQLQFFAVFWPLQFFGYCSFLQVVAVFAVFWQLQFLAISVFCGFLAIAVLCSFWQLLASLCVQSLAVLGIFILSVLAQFCSTALAAQIVINLQSHSIRPRPRQRKSSTEKMGILKNGDIISKSVTRNGEIVIAQCKFTPYAEDGKEFHCNFSPHDTDATTLITTSDPAPTESDTVGIGFESSVTTANPGPTTAPITSDPIPTDSNTVGGGSQSSTSSPVEGSGLIDSDEGPSHPTPVPVPALAGDQPEPASMASQREDNGESQPLCQTLDSRCRSIISAIGNLVTPPRASTPHCKPLDEQCRALQSKFLFPPPIQPASPPLSADPCDAESECMSWSFLRMLVAPFLAALKGPNIGLDQFPDDSSTLFSTEGAKLYRLALTQAPDSQQLDQPFMLRLIYRSQLDSLLQSRLARVEMQSSLAQMLWLSIGLALPSVMLSCVYLLVHLRWAILNRREKLQAKRASRDQRLLQDYQRNEAVPRPIN